MLTMQALMTHDPELERLRAELMRLNAERDAAISRLTAERDALGVERGSAVSALALANAQHAQERAALEKKLATLEQAYRVLFQRAFGRSSEKVDPAELARLLAEEAAREAAEAASTPAPPHAGEAPDGEIPQPPKGKGQRRGKGHGARPLPKDLPRERRVLEPPPEDMTCACCGGAKVSMGLEDVSERLDWRPASFVVVELVRPKYRCPSATCPTEVAVAPLPPSPIDTKSGRSRPLAGLLAFIITSKFADHLPLHRLEAIIERQGVHLQRSTLCDWTDETAGLLEGIADEVKRQVLRHFVVGMDETGVLVVYDKTDPKKGTRRGKIWVYRGRKGEVYFRVSETKRQADENGPMSLLGGYHGFVQADADGTFDVIFEDGTRLEVGCNAHARRKLVQAKASNQLETAVVLGAYQKVYAIEERIRDLDPEERKAARQAESKPILAELDKYLDELAPTLVPGTALATAVNYSRNHRVALRRFLERGELSIDNNAVERALRQVAIGRKNWLFAGSPEAAKNAAIFYTLVGSCKELGLDPWEYLCDVIARGGTHPAARIYELTPRGWLEARRAAEAAKTAPPTT